MLCESRQTEMATYYSTALICPYCKAILSGQRTEKQLPGAAGKTVVSNGQGSTF